MGGRIREKRETWATRSNILGIEHHNLKNINSIYTKRVSFHTHTHTLTQKKTFSPELLEDRMKKMYLGLWRKIFLQMFTLGCVSLYQVQVWNCWWWDCRGLHEERPGLPHARHSQFHPVPSSSTQFHLVPASSSWLQQPCYRAWLGPAAMLVASRGKHV